MVIGVAVYSLSALYYLFMDYNTIRDCNTGGRVIWPTTLWHYVLVSMIAGPVAVFALYGAPLHRTFEAVQMLSAARKFPELLEDATPRKFGIQPSMPDWLLMCCGAWFVGVGSCCEVLAYWGYFELFLTKAVCRNISLVYEQIDLWRFGKVTWVLQAVAGGLFVLLGLLCWVSPLVLEAMMPPTAGGQRLPSGAVHSPPHSPPLPEQRSVPPQYGSTQHTAAHWDLERQHTARGPRG